MKLEFFADFYTEKRLETFGLPNVTISPEKITTMNWIFLLLSWAMLPAAPAPAPATGEKIVQWLTETSFNFGEVQSGATVKCTFSFKNISTEPIVLETVRTTCGCTAADWPEAPIEAGATGDILIEFDADRGGSFRKKITVFFNKQRKAETLWIEGEVL